MARSLPRLKTTTGYRGYSYKTASGRSNFLQTDPMRFNAGDINIYRYCGNNPISGMDPMGLCPGLTITPNFNSGTGDGYGTPATWI